MQLPTKAVIAAAGFGTRFLPQTKAMPKEMLPIVDKPVIQHVVEELVSVGIKDIIMVTGQAKRAIEDHFDSPTEELIANLRMGGPKKEPLLHMVEEISQMANFVYVRQKGPYGNGTPLLNVAHLIGDEPFIYTFSDDFVDASPTRFQQLIDIYKKYNASVMTGMKVASEADYTRYGFAGGEEVEPGIIDSTAIIEKPGKENAPSDVRILSGYLFTPDVLGYIQQAHEALEEGSELYYNDALKLMLKDGKKIYTAEIKNGHYYDAGDKLEYLKTVVDFALKRDDIGDSFLAYLKTRVSQ